MKTHLNKKLEYDAGITVNTVYCNNSSVRKREVQMRVIGRDFWVMSQMRKLVGVDYFECLWLIKKKTFFSVYPDSKDIPRIS